MGTDEMNYEDEGRGEGGFQGRDEGEGRREGGRGRGGIGMNPNYFLPKPVKPGDEVEVKIEAQASKGDGIAKKDGFVIFIKGAKEGDSVKVRITEVKARFAIGEIIS
jgi:predicted RNA-binding protein with TRAM domain